MTHPAALHNDGVNPLDSAEDMIGLPGLSLNRANRDELIVEAQGLHADYRMIFLWDEDTEALQMCCEYDLQLADINRKIAADIILDINSSLWLGHFDLPLTSLVPSFRYTQLFRGPHTAGCGAIQDLISIAVQQCDRHYAAFMALTKHGIGADEIAFAALPVVGHA